jgi:hypothetical protein
VANRLLTLLDLGDDERRLRGCLAVAVAVTVTILLGPIVFFLVFTWHATERAEERAGEAARSFAALVESDWRGGRAVVPVVVRTPYEVHVYDSSAAPGGDSAVLSMSVIQERGVLLFGGTLPVVRCYRVTFAGLRLGRPEHVVEPLPGCAYETG